MSIIKRSLLIEFYGLDKDHFKTNREHKFLDLLFSITAYCLFMAVLGQAYRVLLAVVL